MFKRRSIVLINRPFQLRFAFYVCSWLIALNLAYPFIITNLFDYFFQFLALDPEGPTLVNLEKTRKDLLWLLLIMQLIFLSLTFLISIFMSHRIAGPLYKLSKYFKEAKAGNLDLKLSFRKKDYFQDLVPEYNDMMDSIRLRVKKNAETISNAIPKIEKIMLNTSPEVRNELEAVLTQLRNSQKN